MIQRSIYHVCLSCLVSSVLMTLPVATMAFVPAAQALSVGLTIEDETNEPDLATAIIAGNLTRVQTLIALDPQGVDTKDPNGNTPLHIAAEAGQIEICTWLVGAGANVEAMNNVEDRPMHLACMRIESRLAIFKLLLGAGAEVDGPTRDQGTPLSRLTHTRDCDYDSAVFLIEQGAEINVNNGGLLTNCAMSGQNELVEYLLAAGAELPRGDAERRGLLYRAAMGGTRSIFLELFVADCRPQSDAAGLQLLQYAAVGGSPEIGAAVLDHGVPADSLNDFDVAPIHLAAENGRTEFVALLLDRGASIDVRNGLGQSAYNIAEEKNWPEIQALIRERGGMTTGQAFPELEGDYFGQTPPEDEALHFAPGIISIPGRRSILTSSPMFSPDGSEMLCTYKFNGPILHSSRVDGVWSPPEPVPFLCDESDSYPVFSADGKTVFFKSTRPIAGDAGTRRFWSVQLTSEGWSDPRPVLGEINLYRSYWQFSMDAEDSIYLSMKLEEGAGGRDLYRVRCVDGKYGMPESLGSGVNSEFNDDTPFISSDGQTMVFIRRGHPGCLGGADVLVSRLNAQEEWGEAVSAGPAVNSRHPESCPVLSPDGEYLFWLVGSGSYWVHTSVLPSAA